MRNGKPASIRRCYGLRVGRLWRGRRGVWGGGARAGQKRGYVRVAVSSEYDNNGTALRYGLNNADNRYKAVVVVTNTCALGCEARRMRRCCAVVHLRIDAQRIRNRLQVLRDEDPKCR